MNPGCTHRTSMQSEMSIMPVASMGRINTVLEFTLTFLYGHIAVSQMMQKTSWIIHTNFLYLVLENASFSFELRDLCVVVVVFGYAGLCRIWITIHRLKVFLSHNTLISSMKIVLFFIFSYFHNNIIIFRFCSNHFHQISLWGLT